MNKNVLSENIRAALSYEYEYNNALGAYRNAVTTVSMRKNALNVTFGDRMKTMIPEITVKVIAALLKSLPQLIKAALTLFIKNIFKVFF